MFSYPAPSRIFQEKASNGHCVVHQVARRMEFLGEAGRLQVEQVIGEGEIINLVLSGDLG